MLGGQLVESSDASTWSTLSAPACRVLWFEMSRWGVLMLGTSAWRRSEKAASWPPTAASCSIVLFRTVTRTLRCGRRQGPRIIYHTNRRCRRRRRHYHPHHDRHHQSSLPSPPPSLTIIIIIFITITINDNPIYTSSAAVIITITITITIIIITITIQHITPTPQHHLSLTSIAPLVERTCVLRTAFGLPDNQKR